MNTDINFIEFIEMYSLSLVYFAICFYHNIPFIIYVSMYVLIKIHYICFK